MKGYKSLAAWQSASELCLRILEAADGAGSPRSWAVLDQLRRAAISTDVNIVEGYALGTAPLFRRHIRIALGSAVEVERLLAIAGARGYLPTPPINELLALSDRTIRQLYGLLRSRNLPFPAGHAQCPRTANR
jgi:four helix bundle protein